MTVCVAVKVYDGIVFAADSASSLVTTSDSGASLIANVWRHGIKVFNLHKKLPIVAMTAGMGHLGPASISDLAKELRICLSSPSSTEKLDEGSTYTIQQVAESACEFFFSKYSEIAPPPANPHSFELWIGGYSAGSARGEIWKLAIQNGNKIGPEQIVGTEVDWDIVWGGQLQAISRLLLGFDENLPETLAEIGIPWEQVNQFTEVLRQRALAPLVHPAMPMQDAINLADFLVDLTKRYFAFRPSADVVGGDTDIATVTKYEGFKWIKRKHYYPSNLNPKETGHVE